MNLKTKILSILFVASIASAAVTGVLLVFLLKVVNLSGVTDTSIAIVFALVIYFLSGLFLVALLNLLLGKNIIIPVVERQMLDSEREMLTEQLHHSQKMEAVGQLASSIAHDFNNLLTIIDGYTSLILADPESDDVSQYAQEVLEAARKSSFITRKLLSFSHKEASEPVLLDLNTTLQDTDKMLTRLIGEKTTLVTKPFEGPIYVKADPVQIGQVLMNLAVNARDAMTKGGRISIRIGRRLVNDGEHGKPSNLASGNYAEISVHDTGVGIDEETRERIFEAFFTTKESGKGTGLGLSIVKSIMKGNNGFIDVISKVGSGTTFMLYFPEEELEEGGFSVELAGADALDTESDGEVAGSADPGSAIILLVEDDQMIRTLVSQTLEMQGYTVLLAEEGWEGIKVARNHKGKIDLLFTDVVMPSLGGGGLALTEKELYPEIRILFMSGYSRAQLDEEGVPPDAALLEKPFSPDKVVSMVAKQLRG